MKLGQWLSFFSKKKSNDRRLMTSNPPTMVEYRLSNSRSEDPTTPLDNGISDEWTVAGTIETADVTNSSPTHGSSPSSISRQIARLDEMIMEDGGCDIDLHFRKRKEKPNNSSAVRSQKLNWEDEPHLGRVINQRQSSEASQLTIASQGTKVSEEGRQLSKSWSVDSNQSSTGSEHITTVYGPDDPSTSFDPPMLSQELLEEDDTLCQYMKNILCDLPHEGTNEFRRVPTSRISSSTPSRASCVVTRNAESSSEDVGRIIRSRMLRMLDDGSDCDSNGDCNSETHSSNKGTVPNSTPYQRLDNTVMEDRSPTSTGSSDHFANLPLELLNDHIAMNIDDDSNRDSDVATVDSDEEILYSDNFGREEEDMFALQHASSISSNGEESDPSNSSVASSVTSFDSIEFLEDDQFDDGKSKGCCSISIHDITTIHEENDDDIAEETSVSHEEGAGLLVNQNVPPIPPNGESHLRKPSMMGAGARTISTVTDDSYTGSTSFDTSFDSFSSLPERASTPGLTCKAPGRNDRINIDLSYHEDFANGQILGKSSHEQAFSDEDSFTSSLVSFADSAASYDSFSSNSIKLMADMLKEETQRRRSKMSDRAAQIRESSDEVSYATKYVSSLKVGKVSCDFEDCDMIVG